MDQDIKAWWCTELRSGKYQQTTTHLSDNKGFCCLGVLCDLHARKHNAQWEQANRNRYSYLNRTHTPPCEVLRWAGLPISDPHVKIPSTNGFNHLTDINDSGMSFSDIADVIEKHL